jgi:2-polyprenyl-3-methyl-5-hydroxy-6-metoxy-1,4-benzoquinol methylase
LSTNSVVEDSQDLGISKSTSRFAFGKNWQSFLRYLDEDRIFEAEISLRTMLNVGDLRGLSFLDVGCGSGLFSLAAMRLGARVVHSFDFDPQSVACAEELKHRYFAGAHNWTVQQGSILDPKFLSSLGQFDVVYSWGVLHHTGNMWQALSNVIPLVAGRGRAFIALYNDQDIYSQGWKVIKEHYARGWVWRLPIVSIFGSYFAVRGFLKDVILLRKNPIARYRDYKKSRGMAYTTDLFDWLGGYPFEVAKPGDIFDFFRAKGFELVKLKTVGIGLGNNEYVFIKVQEQGCASLESGGGPNRGDAAKNNLG